MDGTPGGGFCVNWLSSESEGELEEVEGLDGLLGDQMDCLIFKGCVGMGGQ